MIKKFNKTTVGLFIAALSVVALAAQDGVNLKRQPKVGDAVKYRLKAEVNVAGTDAVFSTLINEKITKVESNGNYTVESTQSDTKLSISGQDSEVPAQGPETTTFKATGEVVEIKSDQVGPEVYRLANLQSMIVQDKAVKVGDEWTAEIKKDEKTGAVAAKGTYKVEAQEKVGDYDTYRIKYSFKETEGGDAAASVEGTVWVSTKDNTLVKAVGNWKNAPFPGAGPIDAKITLTRDGLKV